MPLQRTCLLFYGVAYWLYINKFKVNVLWRAFSSTLAKMTESIEHSYSGCTEVEIIRASYTWTITNFSFLSSQKNRKIKSAVFMMGDNHQFRWRMRLYPNGCEEGSEGKYISLFLQMVSPCESEVPAKFDFAIIKADGMKHVLASHKIRSYVQWKSLGYHELIERSQLLDSRSGLMSNDCLKLVCEVVVHTGNVTNKTAIDESELGRTIKKNLARSLEILLKTQPFSDATLVAGNKRFPVHKAVLSVRSPVFDAMFGHDMQEAKNNEVLITDVDGEVLSQLICFIYTGRVERLKNLAAGLLAAADKYAIDDLKLVCEAAIIKSLTKENAVAALVLADRHNANTLKIQALTFLAANTLDLAVTRRDSGLQRVPNGQ